MKVVDKAQKISISLPASVLKYAEEYQKAHSLESRSDVLLEAMKALREKELLESYRQEALEFERNPDPWVDSGLEETLELLKRS